MSASAGASKRSKTCLVGVLVAVIIVAALAAVGWQVLSHVAEKVNRTTCAQNLDQIGMACHSWALAHEGCWPDAASEESEFWHQIGNTRTDRWDPTEDEGDPPQAAPGDNGRPIQSNTASLWLLVAHAGLPPDIFICPSASRFHEPDDTVADVKAVRDFRGPTFCSYSYQNVFGPYSLKAESHKNTATLAVAADANPMRRDFRNSGAGGRREGVTDRYLRGKPKFVETPVTTPWNREQESVAGSWELNSPNHTFAGQNVLYLDGHVEWTQHPYVGPNWDNIWVLRKTDRLVDIKADELWTVRHDNDPGSYGGRATIDPASADDSFLAP